MKELTKYSECIAQYKSQQPIYDQLAQYLQGRLKEMCSELEIYPIIMGRSKSLESFAGKICRKGKNYKNPLNELTDLCGVRVITHTLDQVDQLSKVIEQEFKIDKMNSVDKQGELDLKEFGYLSRHYIIQLKHVPEIPGVPANECQQLVGLKAELQIRTLAQHIWADIYHELGYKNEFKLPRQWAREFARLAASLENCDQIFQEIKNDLSAYESSYGAYMNDEELEELAEHLKILVDEDDQNVNTIHRLIRAYLGLKGKAKEIEALFNTHKDRLLSYPPALRDIGFVLSSNYPVDSEKSLQGLEYLKQAAAADPRNIDTLCTLGGAYLRYDDHEAAIDCYRRAHFLDPTNPYSLGNYIAEELLQKGDINLIQYFHTTIEAVVRRCKKQAEVKVNSPWSYFDLGIYSLYLGRLHDSIMYYTKGIEQSSNAGMIKSARKRIKSFIDASLPLKGIDVLDKLLVTGVLTKTPDDEKQEVLSQITCNPLNISNGQILMLAGGCGNMDDVHAEQLQLLGKSLKSFTGTIVSGGTNVGVPALVGEVQASQGKKKLHTIGYLPAKNTPILCGLTDDRYETLQYTDADDFTVSIPLAFWLDYLCAGGEPTALKLIGFNGGDIAAAEYRLALAFGAQVGIIRGSDRAADEILEDPEWKDHPALEGLDLTVNAIKTFINK